MRRVMRSSGDLIADRRYQYGKALAQKGDLAAAAELFEQALERAPDWADAWVSLGRARRDLRDREGAAAAFREALRQDPGDILGASLELARLDARVTIDAAPLAYVKELFNSYAEDFDSALVERLAYATPQKLAAMVEALGGASGRHFPRALDLGCGTGLAGEAFAAYAAWLEGVDVADAMVAAAREKGVYNRLACSDILSFLGASAHQYNLVIASDVFIYFRELTHLFSVVATKLAPQGLFTFSVERSTDAEIALRASLRFAHSANYVATALNRAGLELANMEQAVLRQDRGTDVEGLLVVARKRADVMNDSVQQAGGTQSPHIAKPN